MLMLTSNLVITMCIVELMKPTFISGLIGIQIDRGSYLHLWYLNYRSQEVCIQRKCGQENHSDHKVDPKSGLSKVEVLYVHIYQVRPYQID